MPLTSGINSSSFSLGMEVLRAQVAANGRGEIRLGNETVSIVLIRQMVAFWPAVTTGDYLLTYC